VVLYNYSYIIEQSTGPLDVGMGASATLPRRPIPAELTGSLRQRVKHVTLASNPCRLRVFTQEVVLFREDLLKTMQRHLAMPLTLPTEVEAIDEEIDEETRSSNLLSQNFTFRHYLTVEMGKIILF